LLAARRVLGCWTCAKFAAFCAGRPHRGVIAYNTSRLQGAVCADHGPDRIRRQFLGPFQPSGTSDVVDQDARPVALRCPALAPLPQCPQDRAKFLPFFREDIFGARWMVFIEPARDDFMLL
jgi:hypothetical protein